jgi:hypothetical protein
MFDKVGLTHLACTRTMHARTLVSRRRFCGWLRPAWSKQWWLLLAGIYGCVCFVRAVLLLSNSNGQMGRGASNGREQAQLWLAKGLVGG